MKPDDELVALAQAGSADAAEELVRRYQRKVQAVAKNWRIDGQDHEDKVGICYRALIKAIKFYDPKGGRNFDSWAEMLLDRHMTMAYRKATSAGQVKVWSQVSLDVPAVSDGQERSPLAEMLMAGDDDLEVNMTLMEIRNRVMRAQASILLQHLRGPMSSPLGDTLTFWMLKRNKTQGDEIVLDVLTGTMMVRIMRFGHMGDLSREKCAQMLLRRFVVYLQDQYRVILHLADVEPLGRELDDVDHAIIRELRRHGG